MLALPALLVAAGAAQAEPHRFILLTETDEAARPGLSIQETVRSSARFRLGLRFLTPEESFVEGGLEAESGLSSCAANAACLASRLRNVPADYALLLVARRVGAEELLALRVIRTTTGELVHQAVTQTPTREPVAEAITSITTAAFDALGYARGGELVAAALPENAEIVIGERTVASGRTTLLAPGAYVVRARLAGFEDATASASVTAGATQRVDLVLSPRSDGLTSSSWFWIGAGVLAAAAAGVAIGVAAGGPDRCFCAAIDPASCGSCP